jgi:hypothetical protein
MTRATFQKITKAPRFFGFSPWPHRSDIENLGGLRDSDNDSSIVGKLEEGFDY